MKPKTIWQCRRDYIHASTRFANINREIDEILKTLHLANMKREVYRPKFNAASKAIAKALDQERQSQRRAKKRL